MKDRIEVSPEMLSFVGVGDVPADGWPEQPLLLTFTRGEVGSIAVAVMAPPRAGEAAPADATLVFVVKRTACERLFPDASLAPGEWHLPTMLASLVDTIASPDGPDSVHDTLRLAKSIELLCGVFTARAAGTLLPTGGGAGLSPRDTARIVAARRVVDERWAERLTLEGIARACGINRAMLTRGFRRLYRCTVADAITGNRLEAAHGLLLRSDMPVSSIGYRCGYTNNASFTRAFTRRFGQPPSRLRQDHAA